MATVLALLSVSFLPTYTPSARAAGQGQYSDGSGVIPSPGGPDEPDDGTGGAGTRSVVRPRSPRTGISNPSTPPAIGIPARNRAITQDRQAGSWLTWLRAFVQTVWQVR